MIAQSMYHTTLHNFYAGKTAKMLPVLEYPKNVDSIYEI